MAFTALFVASDLAMGALVHERYSRRLDPRRALFHRGDYASCGAALLGDSLFASHYVDREDQTLWASVERESGVRTFPGALNAARSGDILLAARFLSTRLRPGTVVFIDVTPPKVWLREQTLYDYEFFHYGGFVRGPTDPLERIWNRVAAPIVARALLWRDAPLVASVATRRRFFKRGEYYDRRWDQPPDYARRRFSKWLESFRNGEARRAGDLSVVLEVHDLLAARGLRPVFVLTPLNRWLVSSFAPPGEATEVLGHLGDRHAKLVAYLREHRIEFLDLIDAVPPEGFADLSHTNAMGDAILARRMASFMGSSRDPR